MKAFVPFALVLVLAGASPAAAQEHPRSLEQSASMAATQAVRTISAREFERSLNLEGRSPLLTSLYGTLAGLHALDVISTRRALARGATELNPMMEGAATSANTAFAMKALATASTVLAIDRISKRSRTAAVITAVVANGAMAAIVAHNLRQSR